MGGAYDATDFNGPSFRAIAAPAMVNGVAADPSKGMVYYYFVPTGGYAPNGNILVHSDMVMGDWYFGYDNVDRLIWDAPDTTAPSKYLGQTSCWRWLYDTYGNRTLEAAPAAPSCSGSPTPQMTISYNTANNGVSMANGVPFVYDAAGNTLYDGWNEYWYDAEGQVCAVQSQRTQGLTAYQYIYDPEGARIGKIALSAPPKAYSVNGSTVTSPTCAPPANSGWNTRWLVGQSNEQVSEFNTSSGSFAWAHSNIFAGGRLSATYDTTGLHFELADPLGTKRVQLNAAGQVDETCTSLPFGNDVGNPPNLWGSSCSAPTNALQTNDDATEHHFTGKERDSESGNDYFEARYYSSAMGRFMSPDWSARIEPVPYMVLNEPQSLNLYAYVGNNPLTHTDPDGHACQTTTGVRVFGGQVVQTWSSRDCSGGLNPLEENLYRWATQGRRALAPEILSVTSATI